MELFWIVAMLCLAVMIAMMVMMFRHRCMHGAPRAGCCSGPDPNVDAPKQQP